MVEGRVGNPKFFQFDNGDCLLSFGVGCNDVYTTKAGEEVEHCEWYNCVIRNKRALALQDYITKGKHVLVIGRQKTREKDDRKYTELHVRDLQFLGGPRDDQQQDGTRQMLNNATKEDTDDIPF